MRFIKGKPSIDIEDTPVENIFLEVFMPPADGNYVKVYLMGYRYACSSEPSSGFSNEHIARALNLLPSDVLKAWDYWEEKKIIKKHYTDKKDNGGFAVEFLSLKQLYLDNYRIDSAGRDSRGRGYSPADLTEALRDQRISEMFHQIQQLMCRPLNPSESLQCLEWLYDFKMRPDIILEAFKYSIEKKGIKNIKYINAIITGWYDNNINTPERLEEYLESSDRKYSLYNKVMKAIGITRNPSKKEKEYMDKWFNEYKMPFEIVLHACDTAFMRIPNPTMAYIDGIITDWHKNNISSIEEIAANTKKAQPPRRKTSKNRFHNFDQPMLKYSKQQLDEILFKKKNL